MTKRIFTFLRKKQARRIKGAKYPAELSGRTAKYYKIKEEKAKSRLQKIFGKKNIKESKARIAHQTYKVYDIIRKDMPKTIFIHDPQARVLIRVRLTENAVKAGIVRRSRINTSKVAVPILTAKKSGEELSIRPTLEGFETNPAQVVSRVLKRKKFSKKFFP